MFNAEEPFWGKTLRLIKEVWQTGDPEELKDRVQPDLPEGDLATIQSAIDSCLEGKGGEVSARSRAAELGRAYLVLNEEGRLRFLTLLAEDYGVDNAVVEEAIRHRAEVSEDGDIEMANHSLRTLLEPKRTKLLRQFNELQEGVKFLVDLRADLVPLSRNNAKLKALDQDVHRLLVSWFDVGFLDLRRITWDTPAAILEKLIEYEAVHAISSWQDLKNRLRQDRRCYAFFHPRMPEEPLIFVEVALVNGIADNVQELLNVEAPVVDPQTADTAIFYSISNCQKGLAGVSFGNFLIKKVVADLSLKMPNIKIFSTLSPIPGFLQWLQRGEPDIELTANEQEVLAIITSGDEPAVVIKDILSADQENDQTLSTEALQSLLLRCCAHYLVEIKRGIHAYDRVCHFHLTNGAQLERINWRGNVSSEGFKQSATIMANYLYNLSYIERNHELYTGQGEIAVSTNIRKLL